MTDLISRAAALAIFEPATSMVRRRIQDDIRAMPAVAASQAPDPAVKADSCQRVAAYLERRRKSKQTDYEDIHGYDAGCKTEVTLLASDLEALIASDAQPAQSVRVKPLVELPVFVLVADDHDYDAGSQWVAGVFLTEQEAVDAKVVEDAKPRTCGSQIFPWSMIVDTARILAAIETQPDTRDAVIAQLVSALEWYGEQSRLARLIHSEGDKGRHAISADGGARASAALAAAKGGAA